MPALTINAATVPVRTTAGGLDDTDATFVGRRMSGDLCTIERGTITHLRVLRAETPVDMDRATVLALEAEIVEAQTVTVGGWLWGDESEAEARNVAREDGPLVGHTRLTFELHEVES